MFKAFLRFKPKSVSVYPGAFLSDPSLHFLYSLLVPQGLRAEVTGPEFSRLWMSDGFHTSVESKGREASAPPLLPPGCTVLVAAMSPSHLAGIPQFQLGL